MLKFKSMFFVTFFEQIVYVVEKTYSTLFLSMDSFSKLFSETTLGLIFLFDLVL